MFDSLVTINVTSLFFHNRRFETPTTKKDIANNIKAWMQHLQVLPLPQASKKSKVTLAASTASESKASLTLVKSTTTTTTTTKPTSCVVVFASTTDILQKNQARGTKRQVEELECDCDSDYMTSALYGGLDEDEDDEMEAANAALSPLKPAVAAQMSKVSSLHGFEFTTTLLLTSTQYCSRVSLYSPGSHLPNKRRSPQRDKAIINSPIAHSTMGGGCSYLSQLFFNMSVVQIGMSGDSNNTTPFKHYKQFGMKFTKDASKITGGK